jgi:hypothetical protein
MRHWFLHGCWKIIALLRKSGDGGLVFSSKASFGVGLTCSTNPVPDNSRVPPRTRRRDVG